MEIISGDAQSIFESFSETIGDLCDVIDNGDSTEINFAKLVSSIKNTMSDLGPLNPLFNSHLKLLRENLIPKVLGNWDDLSEVRKCQFGEMGIFFLCKLHLFANFATVYIVLIQWFCQTVMSLCLLLTQSSLVLHD